MAEYVRVHVGSETAHLDKLDDGKWTKQLKAPGMPGEYGIVVEIGKPDGDTLRYETSESVVVSSRHFDLGKYGKLNEKLIKRIVSAYCGCACHVMLEGSTVLVLVRMDRDIMSCLDLPVQKYHALWEDIRKDFQFWDRVMDGFGSWHEVSDYMPRYLIMLREMIHFLQQKIPAHLNLSVRRYSVSWENIRHDFHSWNSVKENFRSWQDVHAYMPRHFSMWREIKREFSSWDEVASVMPDWRSVLYHQSSDYAVWNEIKTGFRTWADVIRKHESWDDVQIYMPVEPLGRFENAR